MKAVETEDIDATVETKLAFSLHISEKIKATSIKDVLRRMMEYMYSKTFKVQYMALVRPHLEYVNQVWWLHLKKKNKPIENVQI